MVDDELDLAGSHWGDVVSTSSNNEADSNESKPAQENDNDDNSAQSKNKESSATTTSTPSKSKHSRISTLRSSRFNKKSVPKVHIESVTSSDPLGPLGSSQSDTTSSDSVSAQKTAESERKAYGDKDITTSIKHFNSNNERLALFGNEPSELTSNPFATETSQNSNQLYNSSVESATAGIAGVSIDDKSSGKPSALNPNAQLNGEQTASLTAASSQPNKSTQLTNTFEVSVGDPIKVGDITSAHTVYTVHTKTNSPNFSSSETSVTRRYRDFRWLYHALENNNPGIIIPPPPEKQAVGRFDENFVESRRAALESMINKCVNHPILQNDPDLRIFLESETFSTDIKSKQYQAQNTSVSGGSESKGFMSSLGGAFSFSGKYVETDEWFIQKKNYVDTLENHFRYLSKSLESVVTQRNELSDATSEFSIVLNSLSQVELSKSFGELIERFSDVETRIRDLYYRQCMQDVLSLGTTLDEYIRLLTSIRNVFAQRQKSYFAMQSAEQELTKKRQHLEKVMKQGKTLQDKIAILRDEVVEQEKKVLNARVAFDDISKSIIKEFARFEESKASDFRNSIELYLENAVEAQKEAIEIWETFYQLSGFVPVSSDPEATKV